MRTRSFTILAFNTVLVTVMAVGCARSHRRTTVVYEPARAVVAAPPVIVPAPTSDAPAVRVYPDQTPAPVVSPPPGTPPGVAVTDVVIADSISSLFKGDGLMRASTRDVQATVKDGVVTLRGTVPSDHDRQELLDQVARLPGVDRVRDQLETELR